MTDIKTWASLAALSEDERSAYTPEDLEALKSSIQENEDNLIKEREEKEKKLKEDYENQKVRAEKAEKKEEPKYTLSEKDIFALSKSNLEAEDLDELKEFAQLKKISVSEALSHKTWQTIQSERLEERKSAKATETKTHQRTAPLTAETVLEKARAGQAESDADIERIVEARMEQKLKKD